MSLRRMLGEVLRLPPPLIMLFLLDNWEHHVASAPLFTTMFFVAVAVMGLSELLLLERNH
jgi:hypothetical protein